MIFFVGARGKWLSNEPSVMDFELFIPKSGGVGCVKPPEYSIARFLVIHQFISEKPNPSPTSAGTHGCRGGKQMQLFLSPTKTEAAKGSN